MTEACVVSDPASLAAWFTSFCSSFRDGDPERQRNFDLKELHTRKVCEAAGLITLDWEERPRMLAGLAALCHDLGRFPQYRQYGTFKDADSVNHAELSCQVIRQHALLDFLPPHERDAVMVAVRLHNAYQAPPELPPDCDRLLRAVRDADKIDIWRVFIDYFYAPEGARASAAGLGFPDLPDCSPEVLAALREGRLVRLDSLNSLHDFKLLQLSWIYDINFPASFRLIAQRGVLDQLAGTLPRTPDVVAVLDRVRRYLEERLREK